MAELADALDLGSSPHKAVGGSTPPFRKDLTNFIGGKMKVEITKVDEYKRRLSIEIPNEIASKELSKVYQEINQKTEIRGFRKGKAPRKILEQYYKKDAEIKLLQRLVPQACDEAFKKNNLKIVGEYLLEEYAIKAGEALKLNISVEVKPEITLKDYKGIKIQKKPVDVSQEEIDNALTQIQHENAEVKSVESRSAQKGDEIIIDFKGKIDGKPFKGGVGKDFKVILCEGKMIEGFEYQLLGVKIRDRKEVEILYPKDSPNQALAGKKIVFEALVKDVKERILLPLDDEFAKDLGNYNDLNALKDKIREDVRVAKENYNKFIYQKEIVEKLLEENPFTPPPSLVNREFEFLKKNFTPKSSPSEASETDSGSERKKVEQELLEKANKRVRESIILEKIAEEEKIEVEDKEVDEEIKKRAESANQNFTSLKHLFKQSEAYEAIRNKIREEKVLNFLLDYFIIN